MPKRIQFLDDPKNVIRVDPVSLLVTKAELVEFTHRVSSDKPVVIKFENFPFVGLAQKINLEKNTNQQFSFRGDVDTGDRFEFEGALLHQRMSVVGDITIIEGGGGDD